MKVSGVDVPASMRTETHSFDILDAAQAFGERAAAMALNMQQRSSNSQAYQGKDYSPAFEGVIAAVHSVADAVSAVENAVKSRQPAQDISPVIASVQSLSEIVGGIRTLQQKNGTALADIVEAVSSIRDNVKNVKPDNTYNIDIHQQDFKIADKSDADYLARSAVEALRRNFGNGGV